MSKRKDSNKALGKKPEGATEEQPKEPQFKTDAEANAALAQTAKTLNMAEHREKKAAKAAKLDKAGRPKLPPLPRAAAKSKPEKPCECGCGFMTKSRFYPGHDSRLRGWSLRVARKLVKLEDIPAGEREAVEKFIKELKKMPGAWEKLQNPQPATPKAKPAANQ